ncbi:hypothetical protein scyTo_0012693 [Scyliorhinus torazame]|uniref:Uncharacterized protein n=1 Tax=Scyliorhinus torazame TaxID=75743 RepID=A0A401NH54_SCYTO|nr:hypothetical protein [Scyliorhinus torazame]
MFAASACLPLNKVTAQGEEEYLALESLRPGSKGEFDDGSDLGISEWHGIPCLPPCQELAGFTLHHASLCHYHHCRNHLGR